MEDYFAPGQYSPLSQAERLSRPSFELKTSGVEIANNQSLTYDIQHRQSIDMEYEEKLILADGSVKDSTAAVYAPPEEVLEYLGEFGAASRKQQSKSGINRFTVKPNFRVKVISPRTKVPANSGRTAVLVTGELQDELISQLSRR